MTQSESAASASPETARRQRSKFLQWNIATLLLLMAVVGVWTGYFRTKSETARMDAELDSLRQLARELVVNDPSQYAIVERHEQWFGDHVWDVHLPEGSRYDLKLATREIGTENFPETEHVAELAAGQHVISLEKTLSGEDVSARAIVDGKPGVQVFESSDWNPGGGFSSHGGYSRSTPAPPEKPLGLLRIRFHEPATRGAGTQDEPYNGIILWIERKQ